MKKLKVWIRAARLRTLPLSLSGIITGTALANLEGYHDNFIFILCLLITVGFQITSNFANDYGDGVKGTDAEDRIGPKRALQSGLLSKTELIWGITVTAIVSLILVIILLHHVFGIAKLYYFLAFLAFAILSVWAAIKYTVGKTAYGYRGLGDVFVFLFFGLLSVLGTKFLFTQQLDLIDILPATFIGLLCVGVLNLNNLRDIVSDKVHGKNTLVVRLGFEKGKIYHLILLLGSFVACSGLAFVKLGIWGVIPLVPYVFILLHLVRVMRTTEPVKLDPELKKLALFTFLLSMLLYVTINYFL